MREQLLVFCICHLRDNSDVSPCPCDSMRRVLSETKRPKRPYRHSELERRHIKWSVGCRRSIGTILEVFGAVNVVWMGLVDGV